ncbi:MAG TPA: Ig-like domain-containing protein, partial [Verrucomicrobiae bacterium]
MAGNKMLVGKSARRIFAALSLCTALELSALALDFDLEGLDRNNSTNWIPNSAWSSVNLQDWRELDFIPMRAQITGGPAANQLLTIAFPHYSGGVYGFQNLYFISNSPNVSFSWAPVLNANPASSDWSYDLHVTVTGNHPGYVYFYARLAAGAHLNPGSSLHLEGPSLSPLQIHKPRPGPGSPDLAIQKTGPATAGPGDLITYSISYTNKASGTNNAAHGVQITDILPALVTFVSASDGGTMAGNTLSFDIRDLTNRASGFVTYQVRVASSAVSGQMFTNNALILSSEDDANMSDNRSSVKTTVIASRPPIANPDAYTTSEDAALAIGAPGVLANDSDPDGNAITAQLVSGTTNGTLSLNASGSFNYTPNPNFNGIDGFNYRATDGSNFSSVVSAVITVTPINDPPVAANDDYTVNEDTVLTVTLPGLLANDVDPDGDALTSVLLSNVTHGALTLNPDGSFVYTPAANFHGVDSFLYRAGDGASFSSAALVRITVAPVNDMPIARDDSYTTTEDTTLTIPLPGALANDSDADGDVLTAIMVSNPAHGSLSLNSNGGFVYRPNTNYNGMDTFTYRATDGGLASDIATVTLTVASANDAPVARDDTYTTPEDSVLTIVAPGVLANDSDPDGTALTAVVLSNPARGVLTLNPTGGFTYRPNTNFNGTDTFTYRATDGALTSAVATVTLTITPVNDRPTPGATGDNYSALEDQTLIVPAPGVLGNDSDIDGDSLAAVLINEPAHGAVTLNANGSFVYAPSANYFGADSFVYVASDGRTNSVPATVNITVTPVNDAPSFVGGGDQKANQNSPLKTVNWASNISAGPTNESGQTTLFWVSNDNPSLFALVPGIAPDGKLRYRPATNAFGVATVRVTLRDDGGVANGGVDASSEVIFTITINSPPAVGIVSPLDGTVLINPATFSVLADATDPDGTVTNVLFMVNGAAFTNVAQPPFYFVMTNAAPGNYQFRAVAADDCGLLATSAVVNVSVVTNTVVATGALVLNHQNGLFEQFVVISNATSETWLTGVRLRVLNLDSTNRVYNFTGIEANGTPCLDATSPVPPGSLLTMVVQYYVPNPRSVPNPTLVATPLPFAKSVAPKIMQVNPAPDGTLRVHFTSQQGRFYFLQSSDDLVRWTTDPIRMTG